MEENSVYYSVLQKALPPEDLPDDQSSMSEDTPPSLSNSNHVGSIHHSNSDKSNKPSPKASLSLNNSSKQSQRSQSSSSSKHRSSSGVRNSQSANHKPSETSSSGVQLGHMVANGDVPTGRPMSAGKVHLPSGKKQATVKAVPREEQPSAPPTQDKVCEELWVGCSYHCMCTPCTYLCLCIVILCTLETLPATTASNLILVCSRSHLSSQTCCVYNLSRADLFSFQTLLKSPSVYALAVVMKWGSLLTSTHSCKSKI